MSFSDAFFLDENLAEKKAQKAAFEKREKAAAPDRIFLIGMMGTGKTTVGKRLARRLGCGFLDLDAAIEKAEGLTVAEIFAAKGEAFFRQLERDELRKTFFEQKIIVATGGGTPCFFDNVLEMNRHGAVVLLTVGSTELAERLWPRRERRPLLAGLEKGEIEAFLTKKLAERAPFYEKAVFKINAAQPPEESAEAIFRAFFG